MHLFHWPGCVVALICLPALIMLVSFGCGRGNYWKQSSCHNPSYFLLSDISQPQGHYWAPCPPTRWNEEWKQESSLRFSKQLGHVCSVPGAVVGPGVQSSSLLSLRARDRIICLTWLSVSIILPTLLAPLLLLPMQARLPPGLASYPSSLRIVFCFNQAHTPSLRV